MQLIEIDKEDIIEHLSVLQKSEDSKMYDFYEELKRAVRLMPTVEAVTAKEVEALEMRLKHLLKSDYIRQFDAKNPKTREYKLDIRDADKPIPHWIPCSERMPEDEQRILIFTDSQEVHAVEYDRRFDIFRKRFYPVVYEWLGEEVTHWMPLPELPKED